MSKYNVNVHPEMTKQDLNSKIPRPCQWPADNFNHLMEQPTQFYATVLALNFLGANDPLTVQMAWTYVGLRVVHSVLQSVANPVPLRFGVFAGSSLVLLGLTVKAGLVIWG